MVYIGKRSCALSKELDFHRSLCFLQECKALETLIAINHQGLNFCPSICWIYGYVINKVDMPHQLLKAIARHKTGCNFVLVQKIGWPIVGNLPLLHETHPDN